MHDYIPQVNPNPNKNQHSSKGSHQQFKICLLAKLVVLTNTFKGIDPPTRNKSEDKQELTKSAIDCESKRENSPQNHKVPI